MVPTMVLGIPGSGTTAIILVGLMVHGLRPGAYLFTEQVDTSISNFWINVISESYVYGYGTYMQQNYLLEFH